MRRFLSMAPAYRLCAWSVGADRMRRRYAAEYIRAVAGQRVLDLGCGPGDLLQYLPEIDYEGYDISPAYVQAARAKFGSRGRFFEARIADLAERRWSQPFDLVLATGVVHHLDDDEAGRLFRIAARALKPSGRLVTLDGCYRAGQSWFAKALLDRDRGAFVRDEAAYVAIARRAFQAVDVAIREDLAAVPYTYIILECSTPLGCAGADFSDRSWTGPSVNDVSVSE